MDYQSTSALLAKIAVYDNRKVGPTTVAFWTEMLGQYTFQECEQALKHFVLTNNDGTYLVPGHLASYINVRRQEWARANPSRKPGDQLDAWVNLEIEAQKAAQRNRAIYAQGKPYAVDVMNNLEIER